MANDGGSPQRYWLGKISTHRGCGGWRRKRRMVRRLGGFWRLLRSTTARRGQKRRRSAALVSRSSEWVLRFNAWGPDGLLDGKAPGRPCKLDDGQRQAIVQMIESGPIPAIHGVVRWRLIDLAQWIFEEFRITIAKQ